MKSKAYFFIAFIFLFIWGFWSCKKNLLQQSQTTFTGKNVNMTSSLPAMTFVHPGILHNTTDLNRIKNNITIEPWKTAYNAFKSKSTASLTYTMKGPFTSVQRDPTAGNIHNTEFESDAQAVWDQAIMWYITGTTTYRDKAIAIINAWASTLTTITGSDAQLAAGDNGIKFANGAEIIRYTSTAWASADITTCENWFNNVFYPQVSTIGDANWGGSCLKTIISMAVFRSDQTMFDYAVTNFRTNACAAVTKDIAPSGQNSETGRDQPHPLGGMSNLADVAEIAWKQNVDLYSDSTNRILTGFEYWCKYNLGNNVPYDPSFHRCTMGPWSAINGTGRGVIEWAPTELIYAHYGIRKGLSTPYTSQYINALSETDATLFFRLPTSGTTPSIPPIEAENYNAMSGISLETCSEGGQDMAYINDGDYAVYNNVDLNSATSVDARVASNASGGTIEVRSGSTTGTLLTTITVTGTGGWQTYTTKTATFTNPGAGVRNIYLVFHGTGTSPLFNLNWFKFK